MKLTHYIVDLGRAVAFYPGLRKLTGSTTATILLCQLLYWSDKTKTGWIYKTSAEIEDETGLTYNEQKTAKKALSDAGLLDTEFKRLDHTSRYRVNQEELNRKWEEISGEKSKTFEMVVAQDTDAEEDDIEELGGIPEILNSVPINSKSKSVDEKEIRAKKEIKKQVESRLRILANNRKWKSFIDFAYLRQVKHNEPVGVFLDWALKNGFSPIYWTPDKMKTMYPSAFVPMKKEDILDGFLSTPPPPVEKQYAPMPEGLKKKKVLY